MVTRKPKGKYTHADYAATPEGERWELIDGVLYHMAAAPNTRHQTISLMLGALIDRHVIPLLLGLLYRAPYAVFLPGESAVEPDLLYISAPHRRIISSRGCEGTPDLVVEILSPSNRGHDLAVKRELYARHSILEYWIVDPDRETLLALTDPVTSDGEGEYTTEKLYQAGGNLTTERIPGLTINVADIFAEPW